MAGDRVAHRLNKFIYIRVGGQIRWDTTKYIIVHRISQLGDSVYIQNLRTDILKKCEIISNSQDSLTKLTANKDLSKTYKKGTSIEILSNDLNVTRIKVSTNSKRGIFTTTYFYWDRRLIRATETFVNTKKESLKTSPSWEFQTFWKEGELQTRESSLKEIQTGKYKWDTNYGDMTAKQIDLISGLEKYLFAATNNLFFKRFNK